MIRVDSSRLTHMLRQLGTISATPPEKGVSRLPWTPEDALAVQWIKDAMINAGLKVSLDSIGNLWGIWDRDSSDVIVLGSHRDSVPNGGAFDGALGVVGAIEVIMRLRESGYQPRHPIAVVAWNDEEGARFGTTLFGSRVFSGAVQPTTWAQKTDSAGTTLKDAAGRAGFPLENMGKSPYLSRIKQYLELHIEQGPILEREQKNIGVVTGVGGLFQWRVTLKGTRLHAAYSGKDRHDPVFAGSYILHQLHDRIRHANGSLEPVAVSATIGHFTTSSALINVVPDTAAFTVDMRSPDPRVALKIFHEIDEELQGVKKSFGLNYVIEELNNHTTLAGGGTTDLPIAFDQGLQSIIADTAKEQGYSSRMMPSWAGHDAMALSLHVPTAMIFVPSRHGLSHVQGEWTDDDDVTRGANVLLHTLLAIDSN